MKWELPQVEEYKGDLVMPSFLPQGIQGLPNQTNPTATTVAIPNSKPSPESPCNADQWGKVQKMVA
jgi:hypothetical protein